MKILVLALIPCALICQTPTIGNIVVKAKDHTSVNITYTTSAFGYCQLKWGVVTGTYIYAGGSAPTYEYNYAPPYQCALTISGLTPSTTYYVNPTVRPDANDATNLCDVNASCGSSEQTFTTLALPNPHPATPALPNQWTPVEPVTTSYTIIPIQAATGSGTDSQGRAYAVGDCVSSGNVSAQTNWLASISTNDILQTILNKIWLDTVIEGAEGGSCNIPWSGTSYAGAACTTGVSNFVTGVCLPNYSPTGGTNDWVVIRTHINASSDFPPFGTRTGPQYASKLFTFVATVPGMPNGNNGGTGVVNQNGQIFDSYQNGANHFWIENVGMTHLSNTTIYPTGSTDPSLFTNYVRFIPACTFVVNVPCDTTTTSTTPSYIVLDRVYAPSQPWPSREWGCFNPAGNDWAILSSYCTTNLWWPAAWPETNPTSTGTVISIPQVTYQLNITDSPIGMTTSATATFTGASTYTGQVIAWISSTGLTIEYQTASGVGVTCTSCTAIGVTSPTRFDTPYNAQFYFGGNFNGSGSFVETQAVTNNFNANPSIFQAFKPLGIYLQPGQYGLFDNNYIQAIGQTIYNDSLGSFQDFTFSHNYFYFPRTKMQADPLWDGYGYSFRNILETKQALRWAYTGNIIDGSASFQNPGNAMYIAGSYIGTFSTGTQDITINNNIFKHLSSGFQNAGGGTNPPDAPQASRIAVINNLWLDLNRDIYNNGGGGLFSGPFSSYPMGSDINISNNTVGLTKGAGPSIWTFGGAAGNYPIPPQTTVMGEGLLFSNNVLITSLGSSLDVITSISGGQASYFSNFPTNPTVVAEITRPAPVGTWQTYLNGSFMHAASSIVPNWIMGNNVIIGGQIGTYPTWTDLTRSQITASIQSLWPSGDSTSVFPGYTSDPWATTRCTGSGATLANRLTCIGWSSTLDLTSGNPNPYAIVPTVYNAGLLGANVSLINQATGTVQNILVSAGVTSLTFSYLAPDSRSCYVDISTTGTGSWTRMSDSGGALTRSVSFTSLSSSTLYYYRIQCYFDQSANYEFTSNEITSGSITTASGASKTVYQTFALPSGATKAVYSFTITGGSTVNQTCTSSPCAVSLTTGSWTRNLTYENNSSVPIGSVSTTTIQIN